MMKGKNKQSLAKQARAKNGTLMRLNRAIAMTGYCARRKAEDLIARGVVAVNDKIVCHYGVQVACNDVIKIKNVIVNRNIDKKYFLFHKPPQVISSHFDPYHRKTIFHYFLAEPTKLDFIGRLDYLSRGLMIMTNDGALKQKISHPRYQIPKIYHVTITGTINKNQIQQLQKGRTLPEVGYIRPCSVKIISSNRLKAFTTLEITLTEGKNRQIRRVLSVLNLQIQDLCRVAIANLVLPANMAPGQYRALTNKEMGFLFSFTNIKNDSISIKLLFCQKINIYNVIFTV